MYTTILRFAQETRGGGSRYHKIGAMEIKNEEIQEENYGCDKAIPDMFNMLRTRTKFWVHICWIPQLVKKT